MSRLKENFLISLIGLGFALSIIIFVFVGMWIGTLVLKSLDRPQDERRVSLVNRSIQIPRPDIKEASGGKYVPVVTKRNLTVIASRGDLPRGYRVLRMEATAYSLRGITKSGKRVGPGVVAVDESIIPLGSKLWVSGGYGRGVALDTGRAIVGNRVDLWMGSEEQADRWGRRIVEVHVYNQHF